MEWKHNIVGSPQKPLDSVGTALTSATDGRTEGTTLWFVDQIKGHTLRLGFNDQGKLGCASTVIEEKYDALLPYSNGYLLAAYKPSGHQAVLHGLTREYSPSWQFVLPHADSPHWSMATPDGNTLYLLYGSCNPHDAYRQAHVVRINTQDAAPVPELVFTGPDDDYPIPQLILAQPERLWVCVRSRGAATISYSIDLQGNVLGSAAFSRHPHYRGAGYLRMAKFLNLVGRMSAICRPDAG